MKEDFIGNRQLKPAYNVQISTQNQYIVNYSIHQNAADVTTLKSHLERYKHLYGVYPKSVVADAGYGSYENYKYLEEKGIKNFVKYQAFYRRHKRSRKSDIKSVYNLYYNEQFDYFVCPMGQPMVRVGTSKRRTATGFEYELAKYEALNCSGCPLRSVCYKGKGNRQIRVSHQLLRYHRQADANLTSEEGIMHRKRRGIEPESVFGQIKRNYGFRRFEMRGLQKVSLEFGLIATAHNLKKMLSYLTKPENKDKLERLKAALGLIFYLFLQIYVSKIKKV